MGAMQNPAERKAVQPNSYALANGLEALMERSGYVQHLGIRLREGGLGHAVVALTVDERHLNFIDSTHGGAIFSLADTALGIAANAYGQIATLVESQVRIMQAAKLGQMLYAHAEEVKRIGKVGCYKVAVRRDRPDGAIIATMQGTVYFLDKPNALGALP